MAHRSFHFIKVMWLTVLKMQRALFPPVVPRIIRNKLCNYASLETPTGLSWMVEVGVTVGGRLYFCGYGWKDFMEHNSVGHRFSLHFRYAGGCKFLVRIFNRSGGRIDYPGVLVQTTVVPKNPKIRTTIIESGVSGHGVPFFKKQLTKSAVTGSQPVAIPASFLEDNKLLLNKKYKRCIVHIPVGAPVESRLTWNFSKNVWRCSLMGGWKNFCMQCQPKKGDVVSIFLDFNEADNMPILRISFDDREYDFIT
ncbi:hypothetical protein ACFE04_015500 [Oxalis oulophora]